MIYLNKIFCTILSLLIISAPALALELDLSVDEEIRKHYNPTQIEQDNLPPLPKNAAPSKNAPKTPTSNPSSSAKPPINTAPPKTAPVVDQSKPSGRVIKKLPGSDVTKDDFTAIKIKKGTKFRVKSTTKISDYSPEGARITFVSLKPVGQRYVTIPAGTNFKGVVINSHQPQLSGNGGLIVIMAESMIFKGKTYSVHAKITKAGHKKIFLNNIKGERGYWKGVVKSMRPGSKFYKKAMRGTSKLAQNGWTLILTPFTAVSGVLVYGINIVGSPLFGLFSKGGHIILPAGAEFEIKLLEDVYLTL